MYMYCNVYAAANCMQLAALHDHHLNASSLGLRQCIAGSQQAALCCSLLLCRLLRTLGVPAAAKRL